MKHDEGTLKTPAGVSLYYQSWQPFDRPRAVLLIAHGLAEHSGRYQNFARFFVDRGYAVYALDHPGHGESDGDRCHIRRFSQFTDGVGLLLEKVREEIPDTLVFLVGHSMGGLIATYFLIEHQSEFAGCILSGSAVQPVVELSFLQRLTVQLFSKFLPKLRLMQLDASKVSRDPAVVDRYRNDPLVFTGKVTARLLQQLFSAMAGLEKKLATIELPMLILHGECDDMTLPAGSKMLHQKTGSTDKKLIIYEGLYHEIFNEPEQEDVMTDVADWLAPRLVSPAQS